VGHGEYIGMMRYVFKILVENPERERLLWRWSYRLEYNIKVYPRKWEVE
jgi:hypothetical protein